MYLMHDVMTVRGCIRMCSPLYHLCFRREAW